MNCREIYPNRSARDFILEHLNKKVGLLHIIKLLSMRKSLRCVWCRKVSKRTTDYLFDGLVYLGGERLLLLILDRAEEAQVEEMLEELGVYIKVAVDIEKQNSCRRAICMRTVKQNCNPDGSRQEAIWEPTEPLPRTLSTNRWLISVRAKIERWKF